MNWLRSPLQRHIVKKACDRAQQSVNLLVGGGGGWVGASLEQEYMNNHSQVIRVNRPCSLSRCLCKSVTVYKIWFDLSACITNSQS